MFVILAKLQFNTRQKYDELKKLSMKIKINYFEILYESKTGRLRE